MCVDLVALPFLLPSLFTPTCFLVILLSPSPYARFFLPFSSDRFSISRSVVAVLFLRQAALMGVGHSSPLTEDVSQCIRSTSVYTQRKQTQGQDNNTGKANEKYTSRKIDQKKYRNQTQRKIFRFPRQAGSSSHHGHIGTARVSTA